MPHPAPLDRAQQLIQWLRLQPHPEGGHYRERFRSPSSVMPADSRTGRCALTTIDFLLQRGEFSAWHRVMSDEVWHLLEGGPLRLWLIPPDLSAVELVDLGAVDELGRTPSCVVLAGWWQAAEPLEGYALCGATVGPGFEFADFSFMRTDAPASRALAGLRPDLVRLG